MKMHLALPVLALLALPLPAQAQKTPYRGDAADSVAERLVVDSTPAILFPCKYSGDAACFRIYFEIRPKEADASIAVARIPGDDGDYETRAFAGTGASCIGRQVGGLPAVTNYSDNTIEFKQAPFIVTASKPATYMLQFACDGKLLAGDEVTVQITFAADATGRGPKRVRYVFSRLALQAAPK